MTISLDSGGGYTGVSWKGSSETSIHNIINTSACTLYAPLKSSLILSKGTGDPTWSRATKAWDFDNEGKMIAVPAGAARFSGARMVYNRVVGTSEQFNTSAWTKSSFTTPDANTLLSAAVTAEHSILMAGTKPTTAIGESWLFTFRVEYTNHDVVQLIPSSLSFGSIYANYDLINGTVSASGCTGTITPVSPGVWDISLLATATLAAAGGHAVLLIVAGMGAARYATFAGDGVKSLKVHYVQFENVSGQADKTASEYVSVGVESSPYFGAGIDGAKYFETDWQGAPLPAASILGFRREAAATNNLLHSRDLSNAAWSTKTNITAAKTATGLDGIANTASTLTATVADAIILQPITLASADRCASAYVKRRTGTGSISFTQDGGSTWTDITSQINGSTWSRVQITATLANPSVGFKISTSGDAIDVDCVQNEAGAVATSPIVTTTATVTRNEDSLTYQTASNIDFAAGTIFAELKCPGSAVSRFAVEVGSATFQLSATDANTDFRAYDTTLTAIKTGMSDITTGRRKRAVSWGPAGLSVTGDGLSPVTVGFDGSYGSGATVSIGRNINGYIGPVAIYNYQMTNAELQAITS